MRKRVSQQGVTVNAIAGTYVVFLGFDLADDARKGCLGFAIHRTDQTEGEGYWMEGMKTFAATDPGLPPGGKVSSDKQPFQSFQWSDFSAKPEHDYIYRVVPLYGTPVALTQGTAVEVPVRTESELHGNYAVFFNRGAISSQEYARRFGNRAPDEIGKPAYDWLSRGLFEAFEAFLGRANSASFGLHAAIYEFQWPDALAAFKKASTDGAEVHVIYDGIKSATGPQVKNDAAIKAAKIKTLCQARTKGKIMHNKFVVLTHQGNPVAVWTGSTNLTENGIFGHLNVGHIVEDATIAGQYLAYWHELAKDPATATLRTINDQNDPTTAPASPCMSVFSPREGDAVLDWYAKVAGTAKRALLMTFAFGMATQFKQLYEQDDDILRTALMEKEGNGAGLAQGKKDVRRIRARPNVVIAVANNLKMNLLDRWVAERRSLSSKDKVLWIHTKFMLVDPLSSNPTVVTGSANFSKASTDTNDENMIVIRGDTRVADIYFTEYMRLFSTYAFREAVAIARENNEEFVSKSLDPTSKWQNRYFVDGQDLLRRTYYSGS